MSERVSGGLFVGKQAELDLKRRAEIDHFIQCAAHVGFAVRAAVDAVIAVCRAVGVLPNCSGEVSGMPQLWQIGVFVKSMPFSMKNILLVVDGWIIAWKS